VELVLGDALHGVARIAHELGVADERHELRVEDVEGRHGQLDETAVLRLVDVVERVFGDLAAGGYFVPRSLYWAAWMAMAWT
jgi:hypothetical protein